MRVSRRGGAVSIRIGAAGPAMAESISKSAKFAAGRRRPCAHGHAQFGPEVPKMAEFDINFANVETSA